MKSTNPGPRIAAVILPELSSRSHALSVYGLCLSLLLRIGWTCLIIAVLENDRLYSLTSEPTVKYLGERGQDTPSSHAQYRGGLYNFAEVYPDEGEMDFLKAPVPLNLR